jgi:putative redox protein
MATVTVHGGASGFAQEVLIGRHRVVADEPIADGGADTGPSPYDYLLVALGS